MYKDWYFCPALQVKSSKSFPPFQPLVPPHTHGMASPRGARDLCLCHTKHTLELLGLGSSNRQEREQWAAMTLHSLQLLFNKVILLYFFFLSWRFCKIFQESSPLAQHKPLHDGCKWGRQRNSKVLHVRFRHLRLFSKLLRKKMRGFSFQLFPKNLLPLFFHMQLVCKFLILWTTVSHKKCFQVKNIHKKSCNTLVHLEETNLKEIFYFTLFKISYCLHILIKVTILF